MSSATRFPPDSGPSSATPDQGSCAYDGSTRIVTCPLGGLADGTDAHITLRVEASFALADGTLVNTASVIGNETDPVPANNTDDATAIVGPAADLRLTKTVTPASQPRNRIATYTLVIVNDGPSTAADATLTDTLPAGVEFVSSSPDAPTCQHAAGTITCDLGDLVDGASATVTITVRGVAVGTHTNTATVASPTPDSDPANNQASADIAIGPTADLSVQKTGAATVDAGGDTTYALTLTNTDSSPATDATLVDTLPAGMTFVSATVARGTFSVTGQTITFALGTLSGNEIVEATITARAAFESATSTLVNTATVTSSNDNDPANDTDTHPVSVGPAADLSLTKSAPQRVPAGGRLLYTLQVANAGPQTATGVVVTDTLPPELTFASAQPTQGACAFALGTVTCDLGAIVAGGNAQVVIAADVGDLEGHTLHNTASVTGAEPDPDLDDRSDAADTVVDPPAIDTGAISVTKIAESGAHAQLGRPVPFLISVRNDAVVTATGVVIIDRQSAPVDVLSVDAQRGTCKRDPLRCDIGTMSPVRS